ncbi:hypothetical protein FRC11_011987 [Ceratobasidium sp. 423]|nr:hypothetical protein FRC11_011987 [Ceratobasidium sp. 423]
MSRRHPYSSINRRVLQITQLSQIKLIYGLTEELDLEERKENIKNGTRYDHYPDLVFVNPTKEIVLQPSLRRKVAKHVSGIIRIEEGVISNALEGRRSKVWGKMQRLDRSLAEQAAGGDFYSKFSRWRWDRVRPTELHEEQLSYGQAQMFVVLEADFIASLNVPDPRPIVVAIVSPFVRLRYIHDADLVEYQLSAGNYAGAEVIDATKIDCLVGLYIYGRMNMQGSFNLPSTFGLCVWIMASNNHWDVASSSVGLQTDPIPSGIPASTSDTPAPSSFMGTRMFSPGMRYIPPDTTPEERAKIIAEQAEQLERYLARLQEAQAKGIRTFGMYDPRPYE